MNQCSTCQWWQADHSAFETKYYCARWLHERPEGWGYCRYSVNDRGWHPDIGARLAVALETDDNLAALATAPDYGCVAWQEKETWVQVPQPEDT